MTNVGLIGCGAIGTEIATAICAGKTGDARLVALFDQDEGRASALAARLGGGIPYFTDFARFMAVKNMEMVLECASPAAAKAHAEAVLSGGKDLLMISSGALADTAFFNRLSEAAARTNRRMLVPTGALGGIDAIRACRGLLQEVSLTTTKTPRSLQGAAGFKDWEGKEISQPTVIFDGNALEAIKLFPANVNVGVTLSLAGLGPEKTKVKIVADPKAPGNVHEVYAKGDFGVLRFRLENKPHVTNPRTSYLAILSVIETLRTACTPGPRIGT
jgi:aspartate dehydrogenase